MYEEFSPAAAKAAWNPVRDVWETDSIDLLSEHSAVFSETWPASGSMRNGQAFERPTLGPRTNDSGNSSSPGLPTPKAMDGHSAKFNLVRPAHMDNLETRIARLPTPGAADGSRGGPQPAEKRASGGHQVTLQDAVYDMTRGE